MAQRLLLTFPDEEASSTFKKQDNPHFAASEMHLRPFQASDISDMITIEMKCNLEDPLALYMVKAGAMETHPHLCRQATLQYLKMLLKSPGVVTFVVELDEHNGGRTAGFPDSLTTAANCSGQIIGWAIWSRGGNDDIGISWQRLNSDLGTRIEFALLSMQAKLFNLWNPLADHKHREAVLPIMRSEFDPVKYPNYWKLEGCYVDPDWQRRGAGKLALNWGLRQAQVEDVSVLVKASPKGVELYEKAGFEKVEKEDFGVYFDTGGQGFWKMAWAPKT